MGSNQNANLVAFTMGLPGTGKTYFTSLLSASGAVERISTDEIRMERSIEKGNDAMDKLVYRIAVQRAMVQAAQKHVVIDATFYKNQYRELLYQHAMTEGFPLCCFLFSVPNKLASERIHRRQRLENSVLEPQGVREHAAFLKIYDEFEPLRDEEIALVEFIIQLKEKNRTWAYKMCKAETHSQVSIVENLLHTAGISHD